MCDLCLIDGDVPDLYMSRSSGGELIEIFEPFMIIGEASAAV